MSLNKVISFSFFICPVLRWLITFFGIPGAMFYFIHLLLLRLFNLAVNYFELKKYKEYIETLNKANWQNDNYLTSINNEASAQLKLQ